METQGWDEFRQIKDQAESFYKSVGKVFCIALQADVYFTSDGFHHLRYDGNRSERSKPEQRNKLIHLRSAVDVVKRTTTLQEYRRNLQAIGKIGKDGFRKTCAVEYFAFTAITNIGKGIRLRVVIRKVSEGQLHFWSVMPLWEQYSYDGTHSSRIVGSRKIEDE